MCALVHCHRKNRAPSDNARHTRRVIDHVASEEACGIANLDSTQYAELAWPKSFARRVMQLERDAGIRVGAFLGFREIRSAVTARLVLATLPEPIQPPQPSARECY